MSAGETVYPESLHPTMIAPCGMDCGICSGHLREKNRCMGCNGDDAGKPKHCLVCRIKNCDEMKASGGSFCYARARFPCARLRQLDTRYRTKYGMSMVENLESIQELGLDGFVALERERWKCAECGAVVCAHRGHCIYCGHIRTMIQMTPITWRQTRRGTHGC